MTDLTRKQCSIVLKAFIEITEQYERALQSIAKCKTLEDVQLLAAKTLKTAENSFDEEAFLEDIGE